MIIKKTQSRIWLFLILDGGLFALQSIDFFFCSVVEWIRELFDRPLKYPEERPQVRQETQRSNWNTLPYHIVFSSRPSKIVLLSLPPKNNLYSLKHWTKQGVPSYLKPLTFFFLRDIWNDVPDWHHFSFSHFYPCSCLHLKNLFFQRTPVQACQSCRTKYEDIMQPMSRRAQTKHKFTSLAFEYDGNVLKKTKT